MKVLSSVFALLVIVIPAGLPHWYKEVIKRVADYAVNVDRK